MFKYLQIIRMCAKYYELRCKLHLVKVGAFA